ncbi:MerR family transcriptional regulator [Acinetobacter sp. ME22]|uniref:MerR family transcriptional regulator n=1 Tax=Acinetobacter sp. ME22 TaxID=2904802 RepID=UPI001EDBAA91|nr:MerR family transcriptional regulator [Acinetobacter sp. ME22]MCG2573110.1 MerR family transcriptional regulator [Acinetobacter sp. ME22]
MLIHALSKRVGLSRDTLRFYEKLGLIESQRAENGYRHYTEQMVFRLELIQLAKSLGFQLNEIAELIGILALQQQLSVEQLQESLQGKLKEIDDKLQQLQSLKGLLQGVLSQQLCPIELNSQQNLDTKKESR